MTAISRPAHFLRVLKTGARPVLFVVILPWAITGCAIYQAGDWPVTQSESSARARAASYSRSIRPLAEALLLVYEQQVDAPTLSQLALAALRGLERTEPAGTFLVAETALGASVAHRDQSGSSRTMYLTWGSAPALPEILRELQRVIVFGEAEAHLSTSAISSMMVQGLMTRDPAGDYLDVATHKALRGVLPGQGGIGLELTKLDQMLTVVSPLEGTPADRAGLRPGDRILAIDGRSTAGLSLVQSVVLLRGSVGSTVRLTVARSNGADSREIAIQRERVRIRNVIVAELGSGVAYVRLRQFPDGTAQDLSNALQQLPARTRALVLDLRNNGGGLLTAAVKVAELFLQTGQLIVHTEGRIASHNLRFTARAGAEIGFRGPPMVVLINHGSAAASEMVAAALQDWGRATLVGEVSFGRTSIQTLFSLSDGSAIRVTTSNWFRANGPRLVDGRGLSPDIELTADSPYMALADPAKDNQLRRALEVLAPR